MSPANNLRQQAEEILQIALQGEDRRPEAAIVMDREGGLRMLDSTGWSLAGLAQEFGARATFRIERRIGVVRVEAFDGLNACQVERRWSAPRLQTTMLSNGSRIGSRSNDFGPQVLNS